MCCLKGGVQMDEQKRKDGSASQTAMTTEQEPFRLAEGLKMRTVAGETLLMPVGKAAASIHQTAILNKEAARLVGFMTGTFTVDDIVQKGLQVYDTEEVILRRDVEKLVDTLGKAGMLIGKRFQKRTGGETKTISGTVRISDGKVVSVTSSGIRKETSPANPGNV